MVQAYLRTRDVAKALGITRRTLQLWVKNGFVPEPQRSVAGYYLWGETDIENVRRMERRPRGPRKDPQQRDEKRVA